MAAGAVYSGGTHNVANNSSLTIQPSGAAEATIHNIYYAGAVQLIYTNGTVAITFDSDTGAGARLAMCYHVNNTYYLMVKNVSGGAIDIAYDGMETA